LTRTFNESQNKENGQDLSKFHNFNSW